jgi:hypothetical protein
MVSYFMLAIGKLMSYDPDYTVYNLKPPATPVSHINGEILANAMAKRQRRLLGYR